MAQTETYALTVRGVVFECPNCGSRTFSLSNVYESDEEDEEEEAWPIVGEFECTGCSNHYVGEGKLAADVYYDGSYYDVIISSDGNVYIQDKNSTRSDKLLAASSPAGCLALSKAFKEAADSILKQLAEQREEKENNDV